MHFERQSCHIVSLDRECLLHVHWPCRMTIFFFFGGGGGLGVLGGSFYPSNTLDRTLVNIPQP